MNKPLLLALSTAALALAGLTPQVVLAQPYVELGAGMSRADVDCAGTISCDKTSAQARVSGTAGGMRTSDSQRNTAAYAGIGLSYALSPTVALGLNVDGTRVRYDGENANVTMAGLSVRTRF